MTELFTATHATANDPFLLKLKETMLKGPNGEERWAASRMEALLNPQPRKEPEIPLDYRWELPPPVPEDLRDGLAVYGIPFSDEVFANSHPGRDQWEELGDRRLDLRIDRTADVLRDLGLLTISSYHLFAVLAWDEVRKEERALNIGTFTTSYHIEKGAAKIPTQEKLKELCRRLDIDESHCRWWKKQKVLMSGSGSIVGIAT